MTEATPKRSLIPFPWLFRWSTIRVVLFVAVLLITFIVALLAEENWRGKRAWESFKKEQEAKGVNFDRESVIPPPVPDDQNFAMTPFLAPLFDLNSPPLQPGQSRYRDTNAMQRTQQFADDCMKAPKGLTNWRNGRQFDWDLYLRTNSPDSPFSSTREAAVALLTNFAKYKPVLDEIRTAGHRPYSRFNVAYHDADTPGILLPHLALMKKFARIWSLETRAEIVLGDSNAAADDLGQIFVVADSIRDEPIIISHLVRIAILNIAANDISNGISRHAWSDRRLQDIQARLEKVHLIREMDRCVNGERVEFGNPIFDLLRNNPRYFGELTANDGQPNESPGKALSLFPSGWVYFEQVNYNKLLLAEFSGAYDSDKGRVYPHVIEANAGEVEKEMNPGSVAKIIFQHKILSRLLLPGLSKFEQKSARGQTTVDEADVACALERYRLANGQYPDSLTALTPQFMAAIPHDVISGDPLKYRRTDDGQYVLYSVGWNETDDGGTIVYLKNGKTPDLDKGDWVWTTGSE